MTKNPIFNDLIFLCIFIPVTLLFHVIDRSDGLGLLPSLLFTPLLAVALDSMVRFQFMAIDKPILSFERIMYAASWGVPQATFLTINMADFADRADVLTTFAIQFTIMTSVWLVLGRVPQGTDKHIEKQTRFGSRQEFDTYRTMYSFKRSDVLSAVGMTCISIASMIWGNMALGLVFFTTVPTHLAGRIDIQSVSNWYIWLRMGITGLCAGVIIYFSFL